MITVSIFVDDLIKLGEIRQICCVDKRFHTLKMSPHINITKFRVRSV